MVWTDYKDNFPFDFQFPLNNYVCQIIYFYDCMGWRLFSLERGFFKTVKESMTDKFYMNVLFIMVKKNILWSLMCQKYPSYRNGHLCIKSIICRYVFFIKVFPLMFTVLMWIRSISDSYNSNDDFCHRMENSEST